MSNYVLVHGWNSTGEVWNKVSSLLQQHKHQVFCPTLSDIAKSTLQDHISEVSHLIMSEKLKNVILVGHSYAGLVITGVANKLPEELSHLVYVDAALPGNGQSLLDVLKAGKSSLNLLDATKAQEYLGNYLVAEHIKLSSNHLTFDVEKIKKIPKTYVLCTASSVFNITKLIFDKANKASKDENWTTYKLNSSHRAMVDCPDELADILLTSAL